MVKYYVDWEEIEEEDVPALLDAGARYMTITRYPDLDVLCAILGIKKEDEQNDTIRNQ